MLVLTSSCRRRSSFLYSWPILLHPKPPLFLRLDLHQIVFQPVISQILVLGNKSWFGAGRNGRCAGELRLRETLEKCFGAAQASDGTVVLFSGKHRRRRGLPDAFLSWGGNWGSFFVRRRFFLTLSCWETLSRTDRTERTNRGVRLAVIWAAAINLKKYIYYTSKIWRILLVQYRWIYYTCEKTWCILSVHTESIIRHYPIQYSSFCSPGSVPLCWAIGLPLFAAGAWRFHLRAPASRPVLAGERTPSSGREWLRTLRIKQLAVLQGIKRLGRGRSCRHCGRQR